MVGRENGEMYNCIMRVLVLYLVKCYDNKMAKSPFNLIIHPLIKPQVARLTNKKNVKYFQDFDIMLHYVDTNYKTEVHLHLTKTNSNLSESI